MSTKHAKNILIAPLDWGLGHTTRCVPLIQYIISKGHHVIFAGNETQRNYIQLTFPGLTCLHLEGYNVTYSTKAGMFMPALLKQVPSLIATIKKEHEWLEKIVEEHNIDAVVSDNRYGLWHNDIPCAIMTHQLQVLTGKGYIADAVLRRLHYKYLERFDSCWVVDIQEPPGLSGKMGHPKTLPANTSYLGLLSQAERGTTTHEDNILVLLSGPEPQRSMLSATLWQQALQLKQAVTFVEGKANADEPKDIPAHITYHKLLSGKSLADALNSASMVVCRSGYSTIMDLIRLQKKAILIPTPGQTEQEYLSKELARRQVFITAGQKEINLHLHIEAAAAFPFKKTDFDTAFKQHISVVDNWLENI